MSVAPRASMAPGVALRRNPLLIAANLLPVPPAHAIEMKRTARELTLFALLAGVFLFTTIAFAVLYAHKTSAQYEAVFEGQHGDVGHILTCTNEPKTYWADAAGLGTGQCIFSGDRTLGPNRSVSEQEVLDMCNGRTD